MSMSAASHSPVPIQSATGQAKLITALHALSRRRACGHARRCHHLDGTFGYCDPITLDGPCKGEAPPETRPAALEAAPRSKAL